MTTQELIDISTKGVELNLCDKCEPIENRQCYICTAIKLLGYKADTLYKAYKDARNELCSKCGKYKYAYDGACDGCKWKEVID